MPAFGNHSGYRPTRVRDERDFEREERANELYEKLRGLSVEELLGRLERAGVTITPEVKRFSRSRLITEIILVEKR